MKSMNFILVSGLLLTLASCGGNKGSDNKAQSNPICTGVECLSSVNWKIQLPGKSFPNKTRIDVDGTTVLNECVSKQKYYIDRYSDPQMIYLDNYYAPTKDTVKIDVYDLGHCDSETKIISDRINYEINKREQEIVISL